jgi:hypothetical protein
MGFQPALSGRPLCSPSSNNAGEDTMKRSLNAMVLGLGLIMAQWLSCVEHGVVAPGAKVEQPAGDFEFTEGPTCDAEGYSPKEEDYP